MSATIHNANTGATVVFDRDMFNALKEYHRLAVAEGRESFVFAGNEFLTSYAGYLIQYLASKFGKAQ